MAVFGQKMAVIFIKIFNKIGKNIGFWVYLRDVRSDLPELSEARA